MAPMPPAALVLHWDDKTVLVKRLCCLQCHSIDTRPHRDRQTHALLETGRWRYSVCKRGYYDIRYPFEFMALYGISKYEWEFDELEPAFFTVTEDGILHQPEVSGARNFLADYDPVDHGLDENFGRLVCRYPDELPMSSFMKDEYLKHIQQSPKLRRFKFFEACVSGNITELCVLFAHFDGSG